MLHEPLSDDVISALADDLDLLIPRVQVDGAHALAGAGELQDLQNIEIIVLAHNIHNRTHAVDLLAAEIKLDRLAMLFRARSE